MMYLTCRPLHINKSAELYAVGGPVNFTNVDAHSVVSGMTLLTRHPKPKIYNGGCHKTSIPRLKMQDKDWLPRKTGKLIYTMLKMEYSDLLTFATVLYHCNIEMTNGSVNIRRKSIQHQKQKENIKKRCKRAQDCNIDGSSFNLIDGCFRTLLVLHKRCSTKGDCATDLIQKSLRPITEIDRPWRMRLPVHCPTRYRGALGWFQLSPEQLASVKVFYKIQSQPRQFWQTLDDSEQFTRATELIFRNFEAPVTSKISKDHNTQRTESQES